MKLRLLLFLLLSAVMVSFFSGAAKADINPLEQACPDSTSKFCQNVQEESGRSVVISSDGILVTVARTIILLTGVASVIMVIIGGLKYILSAGDSNGIQSAKNTVLYAIVGLVVAVFSYIIVGIVIALFR